MSDRHGPRPLVETVQAWLAGGCRWVWLRDRDLPTDERRRLAEAVRAAVHAAGGTLSVGGDAELAAELGAGGVHLGGHARPEAIAAARSRLGAGAWIGVSAHSVRDVETAASAGADYATLSPVFETASKPGYGPALGLSAIRAASRVGLPVVALGGVTPEATAACREAGAAGIAVMGRLTRPADPIAETQRYLRSWDGPTPS